MVITFKKIDHVQLLAPGGEQENIRKFYIGILGFQEIEKPKNLKNSDSIWFGTGDVHIHIGIVQSFTPATKAHPAFEVESIAEVRAHLQAEHMLFQEDDRIEGVSRLFIQDPFGNRIELLEKV